MIRSTKKTSQAKQTRDITYVTDGGHARRGGDPDVLTETTNSAPKPKRANAKDALVTESMHSVRAPKTKSGPANGELSSLPDIAGRTKAKRGSRDVCVATELQSSEPTKTKAAGATPTIYNDVVVSPGGTNHSAASDLVGATESTTSSRAKTKAADHDYLNENSTRGVRSGDCSRPTDIFSPPTHKPTNGAASIKVSPSEATPRRSKTKPAAGDLKRIAEGAVSPPAGQNNAGAADGRIIAECSSLPACVALQSLQRYAVQTQKFKLSNENQTAALVAQRLGYHSGMDEKERAKYRPIANTIIKCIQAGEPVEPEHAHVAEQVFGLVMTAGVAQRGYQTMLDDLEREMMGLAVSLPVWPWAKSIRGFAEMSLARIVGECGDLNLYPNPTCVLKRMGCTAMNGKMPSTWRFGKEGSLSSTEWTTLGYSPRRRSVMFVIGESLMKGNKNGIYRARYEKAREVFDARHANDDPKQYPLKRSYYHGMLLASKLLLINLWKEWTGK